MKIRRSPDAPGFTLIELMIVVAIMGVLAVLAVYGVRKYVANAKTAEARASLGEMAKDEALVYASAQRLCASATTTVPATAASIQGRKYQSSASDWNVDQGAKAGFACLRFTIESPQYYLYSYSITGTGSSAGDAFTAEAQGDLDGDGTLSMFQLGGAISSAGSLSIAPNFVELRPDE